MLATDSLHEHTIEDDQDFVAVTSTRKSSKNMMKPARRGNNKGKGRWQPPVEKPLSELLQQKVDQLRSSAFLKACQGMVSISRAREDVLSSRLAFIMLVALTARGAGVLREELSSKRRNKCKKCLCFGLGSLRHSPKSLLQLALLQLLLESDFSEVPCFFTISTFTI